MATATKEFHVYKPAHLDVYPLIQKACKQRPLDDEEIALYNDFAKGFFDNSGVDEYTGNAKIFTHQYHYKHRQYLVHDIYEGPVIKGVRDGRGKARCNFADFDASDECLQFELTAADGEFKIDLYYDGEWKDDVMHGHGFVYQNLRPIGEEMVAYWVESNKGKRITDKYESQIVALGMVVTLYSLTGRPKLNGQRGVIVTPIDEKTGRVGVRVDGVDQPLALRPYNLKYVSDGDQEMDDGGVPATTEGSPALETSSDGSSPPDSRVGETLGSGGCVAHALSEVKVFTSVESAKAALNAKIEPYTAKCRPDFRIPEHVGVRDDHWHPEVVKMAVIEAGFHFHKLDLTSVDLKKELKAGLFLVDGVLNDSFMKRDRGTLERYATDPDDSTSPRTNEAGWRHAIAVHDGRILDKEIDMSAQWLWLDGHNQPDPDKGYMLKVLKVYRIFKCTSSDVKCKGECRK